MTVELIINALKMAFESRKPPKGIIIHSDRGVHTEPINIKTSCASMEVYRA